MLAIVGRDPIILLALFGFLLLQVPSDRFGCNSSCCLLRLLAFVFLFSFLLLQLLLSKIIESLPPNINRLTPLISRALQVSTRHFAPAKWPGAWRRALRLLLSAEAPGFRGLGFKVDTKRPAAKGLEFTGSRF